MWLQSKGLNPGILSFNVCHANYFVGCDEPGFKNIYIYFPSTKVYHKNYTENITLIEQFEHQQSYFVL